MNNILKVILSLLGALLLFLAGWFGKAWKDSKIKKDVQKAVEAINKEHKEALRTIKDKYNKKIKEKDDIIKKQKDIIERLIIIIDELLEKLKPINNSYSVNKLVNNLTLNKERLSKLK